MLNSPIRRPDGVSENVATILSKAHTVLIEYQKKNLAPNSDLGIVGGKFLKLSEALASGRFTYLQMGLFKEADREDDYGRIWVKKTFEDPKTGNKEEWLVVYTNDDDEIVRDVAATQLKQGLQKLSAELPLVTSDPGNPAETTLGGFRAGETASYKNTVVTITKATPNYVWAQDKLSGNVYQFQKDTPGFQYLRKTAAEPKPKDVPISPGIKSKNLTIDETGGGGTAKVTVEFSDIDQGLKFFQDQGEGGAAAEKPEAPAAAEEEVEGEKTEKAPASPVPPASGGGAPQITPAQAPKLQPGASLRPTIVSFSRAGQQMAHVYRETKEGKTTFAFVNEDGKKIVLPWEQALKLGAQFERPDNGMVIRLASYVDVTYDTVESLIDLVATGGKKPYFCETCEAGFTEGQMNFHKNHEYRKQGEGEKEPDEEKKEEAGEEEKKEASLKLQAADISDDVPPMSWTNDESQADTSPAGAGQPMPPNQNLQQGQPTQNNVLYDSKQDSGPQFQTTINPKDKSVTVKFLSSPEEEELQKALTTPPGQAQTPAPQQQAPQQPMVPQPAAGTNQQGDFSQQEIPVTY